MSTTSTAAAPERRRPSGLERGALATGEVLRAVGFVGLLVHAAVLLVIVVPHASELYHGETNLLLSWNDSLDQQSTGRAPVPTAETGSDPGEIPIGPGGGESPIPGSGGGLGGGVATLDLPDGEWFILSLIASIFFAFFFIEILKKLIEMIRSLQTCPWTRDFWNFLGCLWQVIVVIIAIIVLVLFAFLFLVAVFIDVGSGIKVIEEIVD